MLSYNEFNSYMQILNLGCSSKTSDYKNVTNIDWSLKLLLKKNYFLKFIAYLLLSEERKNKIEQLPNNILVHNLSKGIPFKNNSIDVVYHSHLLEHIDRKYVNKFLLEVKRVLKPGGIHRIVVPDFNYLCMQYLNNFELSLKEKKYQKKGDQLISDIIEQSVRKEASGASMQKPIIRFLENILLGDARKRGETHQWMYDKFNLTYFLQEAGFKEIKQKSFNTSDILNWSKYKLDLNENDNEYKNGSLYMEAKK